MYIRKPHNIRELFLNKVLSYQPVSSYKYILYNLEESDTDEPSVLHDVYSRASDNGPSEKRTASLQPGRL